MTVAIKKSLAKLHESLQGLEQSAIEAQSNVAKMKKAEMGQKKQGSPDLFSVPAGATQSDVDAKALASRLDGAIAKVEKLLQEEA